MVRTEAGIFLSFGLRSAKFDIRKSFAGNEIQESIFADPRSFGKKIPASQRTLLHFPRYKALLSSVMTIDRRSVIRDHSRGEALCRNSGRRRISSSRSSTGRTL